MALPRYTRASDGIFAIIARESGRATEQEIAAYAEEQARAAARGRALGLGQILVRHKKLKAEEYIGISRELERTSFSCRTCGERRTGREIDEEPRCPACGREVDRDAFAAAAAGIVSALAGARAETATPSALLEGTESQASGRIFGRYEILRVVGRGGMGVVYKARQIDLDRIVGLKILKDGEGASEGQVRRFLAEAQAAARLQHPNIVAIHEAGVEAGVHYFTMDFVEGETLQQKIQRGERFSPENAARLIATLAQAVHYAHQRGIVHRDMKPGNIMIEEGGEPKITDFGLAKRLGALDSITETGAAVGTPLYMSPEQVRGDLRAIDGRTDIFSLGTIFYQLLAGVLPFAGGSQLEIYDKILHKDPVPPRKLDPAVPRDLERICLKALEKRPADRYPSAKELAEDLERALRGEPIRARPLGPVTRLARALRRYRALALVLAVAALGTAAALYGTSIIAARRQAEAEAVARARRLAEARALLVSARDALREGRTGDALETAALVAARYPEAPEADEARLFEGEVHLSAGRPRDSLSAWARAYRRVRASGPRARALAGMAHACAALHDMEAAGRALRTLIERYPGCPEARRAELRLGLILSEDARAADAEPLLRAAASAPDLSDEDRREARAALAWLEALGRPVELPGADAAAVGDADGDGRPELLVLRRGVLSAIRAAGGVTERLFRAEVCSPRDDPSALLAADLDSDGRAEVVLGLVDREAGPSLEVFSIEVADDGSPEAPSSGEEPPPDIPEMPLSDQGRPAAARAVLVERARLTGRPARNALAAGDIGRDGRGEIVVSGPAAGGLSAPALFRLGARGAAVFEGTIDLGGRAAAIAAAIGDVDGDGRPEVVLGTAGPLGEDVRVYRKTPPPAAGEPPNAPPAATAAMPDDRFELVFRRKLGTVTAVLADDLDRDGRAEIALGVSRAPGEIRRAPYGFEDGLHIFEVREGAMVEVFADALDPDPTARTTVLGLASGDLVASSGPALAVLYRVDSGERASYAVAIYEGFGRSEPPRRRTLSFRDRPLEWVRFGDLDADGDAELIAGGRAFVAIYGMARRAPRPGADEEGGATASPHPAREPGPFEAARDLLEIGLAAEAGEAYQDLLRGAATRDEAREAWWGIARAAARAGDLGRAAEAREEIARRFPEAATEVLRARLEDARARWAWRECLAALDALAARPDLEPQERAAIAAERAEMVRRADLAPAIDARFAEPPGEGSIFSDPQRVRWHKGRGDIEVRLGVRPADLPAASPFPPTCAGAAISWGGEPSSVSFEWKLLELEPGAVVRLGLIEGLPGALELAPREPPSLDRAAPPASRAPEAPSPPERLMVELGARPDDLAPGEATPARRHPVSVAAVLGGVRVGRSTGRSDAGFALDVWYRTTIEYVPDPPCARFEISEAAALETTGGPETARTIFRAELSLPAAFAPGPFLAGAFEPPDEPAGAPATLLLRAVRVLVPRTESAPPAPPSLPPPEAEFFRATALQASGRASEAALAYRRAAALSPFMEPAIFGEGLAAREAGDTAAAARAFASCARTIASAREEFRRTLAEMGQAGAAPGERLAALDAFLAVDPDDAWARSAAIEARRSVVEALDRELPLGPDSPATRRLERARLYLRARAPEKALGEAAAALAADPPPDARLAARALATRAEAEAELGDEPHAAIDFARARKADPEAPEPLVGLARLYLARAAGRPAGDGEATRARAAAERALDEAAALARERAGVLLLRSRARLLQGKLGPARADAEQAAALEPRRAECYEQLARIALQEGRRRDASAAAARAFDLGPLDPALLAALRGD